MANHDEIDADEAKLKFSLKTQVGLVGAVIFATAWAVTTYGTVATKDDVKEAVKEAQLQLKPETEARLKAMEVMEAKHTESIAVITALTAESSKQITSVSAKVDFLTQQAVLDSKASPIRTRNVRRAAAKVRSTAEEKGQTVDPLEDVSGLPPASATP